MCKTKMAECGREGAEHLQTKQKRKKKGERGRREMALLVVKGVCMCMSFFGNVIVALPALWLCVPGG